jgi:glycosyltransferase involved in cell wall biosynthesis
MLTELIKVTLWLLKNKVDIVNTHSSRDGWLVGLAARICRVRLLIRTRHIDVDYPYPWVSRFVYTILADHILTTSDKITRHLSQLFKLGSGQITTMPTGIDLEKFCPTGPRAYFGGETTIGMVSVLRSWKGHDVFFKAIAALRDRGFAGRFVVVGGGQSSEFLKKQIEVLKITNSVELQAHREDVPEVLRGLSLLVIPSTRHEGIPQIGLQALACGTPVVGSDVGGIPEIIIDGVTGRVFSNRDHAQLADAIEGALRDDVVTRAMVENGLSLVRKEYSIDELMKKLSSLYLRYF